MIVREYRRLSWKIAEFAALVFLLAACGSGLDRAPPAPPSVPVAQVPPASPPAPPPAPVWTGTKLLGASTGGTTLSTSGSATAIDTSNNVLVVGSTAGGIDGNLAIGTQDAFVTKYSNSGTKIWTRELGVPGVNTSGNAVATDGSDNVFVVGSTSGGLDGNTLTGTQDFFVTKYDSSGSKLWTRQLGAVGVENDGNGAATASGHVFVVGTTFGNLDENLLTGVSDVFMTEYDGSGNKVVTKQLGTGGATTAGNSVSTDASNNVFVVGTTQGTILDTHATAGGTNTLFFTQYNAGIKIRTVLLACAASGTYNGVTTTDGTTNLYVAGTSQCSLDAQTFLGGEAVVISKFTISTGARVWTTEFGNASNNRANGVAVDGAGNVFVTGFTNGPGLGNDPSSNPNAEMGNNDFHVTKMNSNGSIQWTNELGVAAANTASTGMAIDSSGNYFVVGSTNGALDNNPLIGSQDLFLTKYNSAGTKVLTSLLGVGRANTQGSGVAVDPTGNVFAAGTTNGGVSGGTLTGTQDFFVAKYGVLGDLLWAKQRGVSGVSTLANGAASDGSGAIFVAGSTQGSLDGNTLVGSPNDFFVSKFDASGTWLWTQQLGASGVETDGNATATDSSGAVYVAGTTFGGLDTNLLTGIQDFYVTKYDTSGSKQWTQQMGVGGVNTVALGVATDSGNNVLVAGYTQGGLGINTLVGNQDFFVTKYSSTGSIAWTQQLGVLGHNTTGSSVATDSSGNVYVAGYTDGGLDTNTITGTQDYFLTKFDATGAKKWTTQFGVAAASTTATGVSTDAAGSIFVTGYTAGGLGTNTLTGTQDLFLAKYDTLGNRLWIKQLGVAVFATQANGVATDGSGNAFVSGFAYGALDGATPFGFPDVFVTKYNGAGVKQ